MTKTVTEMLCEIAVRLQSIDTKLAALLQGEGRTERQEKKIMATLDELVAKEAAEGDSITKALDYLTTIKAQLDAAGGDQAKLQALSDSIDGHIATLNAAVPPPPAP